MKQIMRKILSGLAALAMVITMAAPSMTVNAQPDAAGPAPRETKVVLTKLKFSTLNGVELKDTFGEKIEFENYFSEKNPETLPGVTFKIYEISDEATFKEMVKNPGDYKTVAQLKDKNIVSKETKVIENTTDPDGKIEVDLPDGNYWFIEMPNEQVVDSAAVPMGISLPMTKQADGDGQYSEIMDTVYVYPKNVTTEKPIPEKDVVSLDNFAGSVDVGEDTDFYLISSIPNGIDKYNTFKMTDELKSDPCNSTLAFDEDKVDVQVKLMYKTGGKFGDAKFADSKHLLEETADYTLNVHSKKQRIEVMLTKAGRVKMQTFHDEAGEKQKPQIVVNFKAHPTKNAIKPGEALNDYTVEYSHQGISESEKETSNKVKIVLSGKNFVKMEKGTEEKRLEGAEFIMKRTANGTKEYYLQNSTDDKAVWTQNKDDAKRFVTNKKGEISVSGLAYTKTVTQTDKSETTSISDGGDKYSYELIEVKAPKGYALLENPIKFTINNGSRTEEGGIAIKTDSIQNNNPDGASSMRIDNTKLTIPQTGGIGALIFAVAGVIIMGAAYIGLKKED